MSMSRCSRSIWQAALVVLCALMTSANRCEFPEFMTRASHWELHVTLERRSIGAMLRFPNSSQAQLTDIMRSMATTTYSCHTAVDHEIFLTSIVTHDANAAPSYRCLRFIRRSDFVVQFARSGVFDTASRQRCVDASQFVLEDSVMVTPRLPGAASGTRPPSCGLVGGYWLSVVDLSGSHVCRDSFLRPILESDCAEPGEGILIDFRQPTCARGLQSTSASFRMLCLGSWIQSGHIFSVLSDDNPMWPKMWMLRIPQNEAAVGTTTAHLVRSLSTASDYNTSDRHALHLSRTSFPSVCENEAARCGAAQCVDETAEVHCQKTCDACAAVSDDASCQFDEDDVGHWLDVSQSAAGEATKVVVTVTNRTVQVGTKPAWWCIEFSTQHRYPPPASGADTKRRPIAMLFAETGCRPRLACVELLRRSEAVIQYRIGRPVAWPVTSRTTGADVVCSDEMFAERNVAALPRRVLVSREKYGSYAVPCGIDAWYYLNGSNADRNHFEGFIDACGPDATSFRYVTRITSSEADVEPVTAEETHRCLANYTDRSIAANVTYIITAGGPSGSAPRFFCWLLERSVWLKNPRLYLTYAAECNAETGLAISYQSYTGYIAQFDLIASTDDRHEWIRSCNSSDQQPNITVGPRRTTTPAPVSPPAPSSTHFPADVDETGAIVAGIVVAATVLAAVVIVVVIVIIHRILTSGQYRVYKETKKMNTTK